MGLGEAGVGGWRSSAKRVGRGQDSEIGDGRWEKLADVRFQRLDARGRAEHVVGRDFNGSGICAVRDVGLRTVMKGENMATERRANNAFSVKIS